MPQGQSTTTTTTTTRPFWNVPNSRKAYDTVADLAPYNPLLFRVSHRNSGSCYFEGHGVLASEHYFVDIETGEKCMNSTIEQLCKRSPKSTSISTDKLVEYVLYNKKERTNFVSTTFSFSWALFFAEMNAINWKEDDVELLVIDTYAVAHRAWISLQQLSRAGSTIHNDKRKKIANAAYSSQEVIISDCIPESAILSRVRWDDLKKHLPSWYYQPTVCPGGGGGFRTTIPIPNDKKRYKYKRWQNLVWNRCHQLSMISFLPWDVLTSSEAASFVLAVLAPKRITDAHVVLSNGRTARQDFEDMVEAAARDLLQWSRGLSYPLEEEDMVQLRKLTRELMNDKILEIDDRSAMYSGRLSSQLDTEPIIDVLCGNFSNLELAAPY